MSRLVTAKVHGGVLVADEFTRLPEGATVDVVIPDDEEDDASLLSPEDEAELLDRVAEAERGDTFISAEQVMRGFAARRAAGSR